MEFPFSWKAVLLTVLTSIIASYAMGFFRSTNKFPVNGRTVVITGASQGMGKAVGILLASKGANVAIVARNVPKLEAALKEIESAAANKTSQKFLYISADLTNAEESTRIIHEVTKWNANKAPDIVWCCAGGATPGLFIDTAPESLKAQMEGNYLTSAYMAQAALKSWFAPVPKPTISSVIEKPSRHLVFTSSVVAFCTVAGYSSYAPTKSALRALSDTLRQEIGLYNGARRSSTTKECPETDVEVHTVFPATIFTPGFEEENKTKPDITKKLEEDDGGQTEQQVAAASVKGLEKGQYMVTTTFLGGLLRAASWGASPRNDWFLDTILAGVMSVVWRFVQPDLDHKVYKWGRDKGVQGKLVTNDNTTGES